LHEGIRGPSKKEAVMSSVMKKVRETWLSPFLAGTAAGVFLFWM
jgi:hypothetical protein